MASHRDLVWDMLAEGLTTKEIAHALQMHPSTIRRTLAILMREHSVNNHVALAIKHPKFTGEQDVAN